MHGLKNQITILEEILEEEKDRYFYNLYKYN